MPQSIADILKQFNPLEDKYISREFQAYGIYLAEELGDYKHRSLYIKLAKTVPRAILEKALSFVKDANARSKPRLFMWKMKELRESSQTNSSPSRKSS
ncbi:MAG: hypothetical protein N3A54_06580 [Patescibacteria group bacterium]|nr:hypothetical protein [Patescibacteria group bacterium]